MINKLKENKKNFNYYLSRYLPKFSELDAYIILLLLTTLYFLSPEFRIWILSTFFILHVSISFNMIFYILSILIALLVGTFYTFHFNKIIHPKLRCLVVFTLAILITMASFKLCRDLLETEFHQNSSIAIIAANIFVAINLIKGLVTLITIRIHTKADEILYNKMNTKPIQVLLVTLLVPFTLYILLQQSNDLLLIGFNTFGLVSIIAHLF